MDPDHPVPWFPAWGVKFSEPIENIFSIVSVFNEWRPSNRWLLASFESIASEVHLWSSWYSMRKAENSGEMIAKTPDTELLRIVSGTHQINKAFERAGLAVGDERAWVVFLPDFEIGEGFAEFEIPRSTYNEKNADAERLVEQLGTTLITRRPIPTQAGLERIGADYSEGISSSMMEGSFISHMALSNLR